MVEPRWTCVLTGTFASMTHRMARQRLAKLGVSVCAEAALGVDFIVVGARPSQHKLSRADALGVPRIDERQLTALLGGLELGDVLAMRARDGAAVTSTQATLERLRGLLYAPPSREVWEAICAVLEGCPSASMEVAVEYVEAALEEGWGGGVEATDAPPFYSVKGELRVAPQRWRERLLAGHPVAGARLVRALRLDRQRMSRRAAEHVYANAQLSHVRCLSLASSWPTPTHLLRLAHSPMRPGLEVLDVSRNGASDSAINALTRGARWPALRVIDLAHNNLTGAVLPRLAEAAPGAETLSMAHNALSEHALESLTQARWPALRALHLAQSGLNSAGMARLARGSWDTLERLDVSRNALWDAGIEAIAEASWPALEVLWMQESACTGRGMAALTGSPGLPRLRRLQARGARLSELNAGLFRAEWHHLTHLDLSACGLDDRALGVALEGAEALPALASLKLADNHLRAAGLGRLLGCAALRTVRELDVAHNDVGPGAGARFAHASVWERLERLNLSCCQLSDADVIELVRAPSVSRLVALDLSKNGALGDAAVEALAEATHMDGLVELNLAGCPISGGAAMALLNAPHLKTLQRLRVHVREPVPDAFEWDYAARFGMRSAAQDVKRLSYLDALF